LQFLIRSQLTNFFYDIIKKLINAVYFVFPKYIKAKKEIVLTIAIKYQPEDELLEISDIYFVDFSEDLTIWEKISNEANKNIKSIYVMFIYRNILTMRKIIPTTTATIAPSTNKSFHV
jgi:hypothetical protein